MAAHLTDNELKEAVGRIALTVDGLALYRLLVRALMDVSSPSQIDGTLPFREGRRSFAAELKSMMDASANLVAKSDRSDPDALDLAADKRSDPVASSGSSGTRRRVAPYAESKPGSGK